LVFGVFWGGGGGGGAPPGGGGMVFIYFFHNFFLTDQSFGGISGFEYQYRMYPYFILSFYFPSWFF